MLDNVHTEKLSSGLALFLLLLDKFGQGALEPVAAVPETELFNLPVYPLARARDTNRLACGLRTNRCLLSMSFEPKTSFLYLDYSSVAIKLGMGKGSKKKPMTKKERAEKRKKRKEKRSKK